MRSRPALPSLVLLAAVSGCSGGDPKSAPRARAPSYGVVEGFYGTPYTHEQRGRMLEFLGEVGFDTYVYAPKNDSRHRSEWRDPYPEDEMADFADLALRGRDAGVRFVFAISPGIDFDPALDDQAVLDAKLEGFIDRGVTDFCVFFDDLTDASGGADPLVQVDLVTATLARLREREASATLCFISNHYIGTREEIESDATPFGALFSRGSSEYYAAYRDLPADVPILWTGPRVFSDHITVDDARAFAELAGRDVIVWDNYPVNDTVLASELYLGPYVGREAGVEDVLDGFWLNPMTQAEAAKIPLFTASRRFEMGEAYDPRAAHTEALTRVAGEGAEAVAVLAEHFAGHPMIGPEEESVELARAIEAWTNDVNAEQTLRDLLARYGGVRAVLDATLANESLAIELREPADKLALLAKGAVLALDLVTTKRAGGAVDLASLDTAIAEANAIPWRVGANAPVPPVLADSLSERTPVDMDVFGTFFEQVRRELGR